MECIWRELEFSYFSLLGYYVVLAINKCVMQKKEEYTYFSAHGNDLRCNKENIVKSLYALKSSA
jgi:hypothetical protein